MFVVIVFNPYFNVMFVKLFIRSINYVVLLPTVTDMLQTAKQFARRYQLDGGKTHLDGLTFGEFCILLADLRGFR